MEITVIDARDRLSPLSAQGVEKQLAKLPAHTFLPYVI